MPLCTAGTWPALVLFHPCLAPLCFCLCLPLTPLLHVGQWHYVQGTEGSLS